MPRQSSRQEHPLEDEYDNDENQAEDRPEDYAIIAAAKIRAGGRLTMRHERRPRTHKRYLRALLYDDFAVYLTVEELDDSLEWLIRFATVYREELNRD